MHLYNYLNEIMCKTNVGGNATEMCIPMPVTSVMVRLPSSTLEDETSWQEITLTATNSMSLEQSIENCAQGFAAIRKYIASMEPSKASSRPFDGLMGCGRGCTAMVFPTVEDALQVSILIASY
jgi:hypothetical protein